MNIILFDGPERDQLLPLTYTRPVAELRIGILTIREKWDMRFGFTSTTLTEEYLQEKYPAVESEDNIFINGGACPTNELFDRVAALQSGEKLVAGDRFLDRFKTISFDGAYIHVEHTWHLFEHNGAELQRDFDLITKGRNSAPLSASNKVTGDGQIFLEKGAQVEGTILNPGSGPIYIGSGAEIMEGSLVRGGLALCEGSTLKLGTKIYGPTTIGPHSKAGGELNNVVILGYSNKGHDGFLGNAVLGEWCNIGADSNNSNLKNNYAEVRLWSYEEERFTPTGLQFCGLIMGDHSKCGINTMFNTGTVVGVSANIFGSGFPRNFVPSFHFPRLAHLLSYALCIA
jgi:UDP-N-acetylglucosamine diphosphorylase/glucosamine-1-phosphate N-acetyltransferase